MLKPAGSRGRAVWLAGSALILLNLSLIGCGVPLAASELTATAEVGARAPDASGFATEASSRTAGISPLAAGAALSLSSAAPSTVAPLSTTTPDPSATVTPSRTPGTPSPSVTAVASGTVSPTVSPSVTRTPSPTPAASVSPSASASAVPSATQPPAAAAPSGDSASAAIALINQYRAANGRPPLVANGALNAAATSYAQLMGSTNSFGHTGVDGSIAETRIAKAGYRGSFKGEALAAGQSNADAAAKTWIASPAHNSIISDASAVEVGVGYASAPGSSYVHYWVLITGVP